jgi:hypothetical protein
MSEMQAYIGHCDVVRKYVGKETLLEFDVKGGWDMLY